MRRVSFARILLVVVTAAVAVTAAATTPNATMHSVYFWNQTATAEAPCTGANFTRPIVGGKCYGITGGGWKDMTGMIVDEPPADGNQTCVDIDVFDGTDKNCTGSATSQATFGCGRCQFDYGDSWVGYYRWECDATAQYAVRRIQCDPTCTVCKGKDTIGTTGCAALGPPSSNKPTKYGSIRVQGIYKCRVALEHFFAGGNESIGFCPGESVYSVPVPCGQCSNRNFMLQC